MGMLSDAAEWLGETLLEHASERVTYKRGANSVTLDAVIGTRRRREQVQVVTRVVMVGEPMNFQFDPAELILNGQTITSARGDRIEWDGRTYDVKPVDSEPLSGPSDSFGNLVVVHTVRAA